MQAMIEASSKKYDEKMKNLTEDLSAMIASMMDQIQISKSSTDKKDSPKAWDPTTVVTTKNNSPPLEGGHSTKNGGMWTLKHDISSPKFYELLINIQLKGNTDMDIKKFYNHIKMCLNAVTIL